MCVCVCVVFSGFKTYVSPLPPFLFSLLFLLLVQLSVSTPLQELAALEARVAQERAQREAQLTEQRAAARTLGMTNAALLARQFPKPPPPGSEGSAPAEEDPQGAGTSSQQFQPASIEEAVKAICTAVGKPGLAALLAHVLPQQETYSNLTQMKQAAMQQVNARCVCVCTCARARVRARHHGVGAGMGEMKGNQLTFCHTVVNCGLEGPCHAFQTCCCYYYFMPPTRCCPLPLQLESAETELKSAKAHLEVLRSGGGASTQAQLDATQEQLQQANMKAQSAKERHDQVCNMQGS